MTFNNPRSFHCTKPGCECRGTNALLIGCSKHGAKEVELAIRGFALHVFCPACNKCVMHLKLADPGHNEPRYEDDAFVELGQEEIP